MNAPSLAIVSLFVASCATGPLPKAVTDGEVDVVVLTHELVGGFDPFTGDPSARSFTKVIEGVACAMHNDKGSWTITTTNVPQTVRVQRSDSALEVDCSKAGFETLHALLYCVSPRQRHERGVGGNPAMLALLPLALFTFSPAAPQLLAATVDLVKEPSASSPDYDRCDYGSITPTMVLAGQRGPRTPGWYVVNQK